MSTDSTDYKSFLNQQVSEMRPSPTFAVAAKANARKAAGEPVMDFSVGQPSEPTPDYIFNGLQALLNSDDEKTRNKYRAMASGYPPVAGLMETREAIRDKLADENGLAYDPKSEILVTTGGKQAIFNAFATTLQQGDKVLMAEPSWVSYADMVKWQGATPVGIPTRGDFKFTASALSLILSGDTDKKIKWLVLNSPSNPTGATYTKEELKDIADVILDENAKRKAAGKPPLMVMSDDIYEHMVYDDKYVNKPGDASAVSSNIIMANPDMKPYTVIVNGTAKAFAMTGWRVGYAAGPKELISKMSDYQGLVTSGGSAIAQLAAKVALSRETKAEREAFFSAQRAKYTERRDLVEQLINEVPGLSFKPTAGAFYAMVDASGLLGQQTPDGKTLASSGDIANYLIEKFGVAVVPGDDFYIAPDAKKASFRMSYATSTDNIKKGIEAIKEAVLSVSPEGRSKGGSARSF